MTINYGVFVNACIQFVIVSFAVFWLVRLLSRLHVREDAAPAGPSAEEVLLAEIRDLLRDQHEALAGPANIPPSTPD